MRHEISIHQSNGQKKTFTSLTLFILVVISVMMIDQTHLDFGLTKGPLIPKLSVLRCQPESGCIVLTSISFPR